MIVTLVRKDANSDIPGVRRRTRILGLAAGRMVSSGSRKTHPSTSCLRILHTKAERGHSSKGCYLECVFISQGQKSISNAARGCKAYTKRQLSYSEDIEHAFSGITAALIKRFGWNFISCLPEPLIVYTLLWTPSYKANRRLISDNQADMQGSKPFLSWSRTGWTGDINYVLVQCTGFRSTSSIGPWYCRINSRLSTPY